MPTAHNYEVIGQAAPGAAATVEILDPAAGTEFVLSRLVAVNTGGASTKVRVFARKANAAAGTATAVVYDLDIGAKETLPLLDAGTIGGDTNDALSVYSLAGTVTFTAFGDRIVTT